MGSEASTGKIELKNAPKIRSEVRFLKAPKGPGLGLPVGCTESPFSPLYVPFGTCQWTSLGLTGKLKVGKGLARCQLGALRRLQISVWGRFQQLGAPVGLKLSSFSNRNCGGV